MLQLLNGPQGKRPISAAVDLYVIADADCPTGDHDSHDSRFHIGMPVAVSCHRSPQTLFEPLDLDARNSQTRDLDDSIVNQVEISRRDILAEVAPPLCRSRSFEDARPILPQSDGLGANSGGWVFRLIVEMLHVGAAMRVLYPAPRNQPNRVSFLFTKGMFVRCGDSGDVGALLHHASPEKSASVHPIRSVIRLSGRFDLGCIHPPPIYRMWDTQMQIFALPTAASRLKALSKEEAKRPHRAWFLNLSSLCGAARDASPPVCLGRDAGLSGARRRCCAGAHP